MKKRKGKKSESERKEKEKAERGRKQREKHRKELEITMQLVQDKQRRDRPRQDRFRRLPSRTCKTQSQTQAQAQPSMPPAHETQRLVPEPSASQPQPQPTPDFSNQGDTSLRDFDWDTAVQQGLPSPEAELSRLIDLNIDDPSYGVNQADVHVGNTGPDVGMIDLPQSLYVTASGSGELPQSGLDPGHSQVDWVREAAAQPLSINGPDFSIGATRDLQTLEDSTDIWGLDGLRDIQASHNAQYYGMHVDLINSLASQNTPTHDPTPTISKSLESLGIVSMEPGPLVELSQTGLSDYAGVSTSQSHGMGAIGRPPPPAVPPSLPFKLNSLWRGPDAELNELRSRSSLNPGQDTASLSQYFQQNLGPDVSSLFQEESGDPSSALGNSGLSTSGLGSYRFGSPGSGTFVGSQNPTPDTAPSLTVSSPLAPLSPGLMAQRNQIAGMSSVASPQQHQSPFPGVGVGIPGSTNTSLSGGGAPHLRGPILENEPFVYTDEASEDSLAAQLIRQKSNRG